MSAESTFAAAGSALGMSASDAIASASHAKTWLVSTVGRGPYGSRVPGLRSGNGYEEFITSVRADNSGKLFERGCKWMLEYVEPYASQLHDVWLWEEWPHNWGVDHGIDLVAESRSGELWAIQAKACGPGTRITKKDIDSFVAEASGTDPFGQPIFGQRLLVASTDLLAGTADRLLQRLRIPTVLIHDSCGQGLEGRREALSTALARRPSIQRRS